MLLRGARRWLAGRRRVRLPTPSNVLAGFDVGVGATLFDLNQLQVGRCNLNS